MNNPQVYNVTRDSFYPLVRDFCASTSFQTSKHINPLDHPDLWAAWQSYFHDKGFIMPYFKSVGKTASTMSASARAGWGFQVPTPLPSDFDADRNPAADLSSGNVFMAKQRELRAAAAELNKNKTPLKKHGDFKLPKINEIAQALIAKGISQPGWVFSLDGAITPDGETYTVQELRGMMPNKNQ